MWGTSGDHGEPEGASTVPTRAPYVPSAPAFSSPLFHPSGREQALTALQAQKGTRTSLEQQLKIPVQV